MQVSRSRFKRVFSSVVMCSSLVVLSACGQKAYDLPSLPDDPNSEAAIAPGTTNGGTGVIVNPPTTTPSEEATILAKYSNLDPNHVINTNLLKKAVLFFDANQARFENRDYITVIDFSKRSSEHRMFIVDLDTGSVWAIPVAHGKGSDPDGDGYANYFSNVSGSNASSLGYYKVAESYNGKHGLSIRLDGLSSTNSNARARAVVIHGADYVQDRAVIQGRSWGCPAVPMAYRNDVVNALKGGSLLYIGLGK